MTIETDIETVIKDFVRERNEVLLTGDINKVVAFQKKHSPNIDWDLMPLLHKIAGMHKAITAVPSLPREHRMKSKHWLIQHGYKSMDDGDLTDA